MGLLKFETSCPWISRNEKQWKTEQAKEGISQRRVTQRLTLMQSRIQRFTLSCCGHSKTWLWLITIDLTQFMFNSLNISFFQHFQFGTSDILSLFCVQMAEYFQYYSLFKWFNLTLFPLQMAQYANPQQFGAPMGEEGQYMQQVDQKK